LEHQGSSPFIRDSLSEMKNPLISTSIAPWLSVSNGPKAASFYKAAFGATETYRLEMPDGGLVIKFSIDGAEFWISADSDKDGSNAVPLGGDNIRIILTVSDPDRLFDQAIKAGATQVFPVGEEHGWRLGRLTDPFGLHWEIGHPLG
jgi:PhnB protein